VERAPVTVSILALTIGLLSGMFRVSLVLTLTSLRDFTAESLKQTQIQKKARKCQMKTQKKR
jgi:hypothetical protein